MVPYLRNPLIAVSPDFVGPHTTPSPQGSNSIVPSATNTAPFGNGLDYRKHSKQPLFPSVEMNKQSPFSPSAAKPQYNGLDLSSNLSPRSICAPFIVNHKREAFLSFRCRCLANCSTSTRAKVRVSVDRICAFSLRAIGNCSTSGRNRACVARWRLARTRPPLHLCRRKVGEANASIFKEHILRLLSRKKRHPKLNNWKRILSINLIRRCRTETSESDEKKEEKKRT